MLYSLHDFIPEASHDQVSALLSHDNLVVKVKKERKTRHGDYRRLPSGKHQITINSNLNPYRFLITLIHEIAHFETYKSYGKKIKPHGPEWKSVFQQLMLGFLRPEVFPSDVLPLLASHFKKPSDVHEPRTRVLRKRFAHRAISAVSRRKSKRRYWIDHVWWWDPHCTGLPRSLR